MATPDCRGGPPARSFSVELYCVWLRVNDLGASDGFVWPLDYICGLYAGPSTVLGSGCSCQSRQHSQSARLQWPTRQNVISVTISTTGFNNPPFCQISSEEWGDRITLLKYTATFSGRLRRGQKSSINRNWTDLLEFSWYGNTCLWPSICRLKTCMKLNLINSHVYIA